MQTAVAVRCVTGLEEMGTMCAVPWGVVWDSVGAGEGEVGEGGRVGEVVVV